MYLRTFSHRLSGSSSRGKRNAHRFWINLRVSGGLHVSSRLLHGSHGRGDVRRQQSVDSDHPLPGRHAVVRPARRLPQYGAAGPLATKLTVLCFDVMYMYMIVFLFAVVECDVLASWTGITSNSTARTFDVVMEYACAQNYEFADGEQRKWSRCDVTGEWQLVERSRMFE